MKKIIFLLLIVFIFNLFIIAEENKDNYKTYFKSEETIKIFNELYDLIKKDTAKNKHISDAINFIKAKIDSDEIYLLIDGEEDKSILSGAFFVVPLDGSGIDKPYILMNINFINIFSHQKSIVFSILIHEIKHAYDYYTNNELFKVSYNNQLEQYLFQMDALYIEALLIENYLIPNNYSLTDFEKELHKSYKNDNLAGYSFIFEGIDMNLVYYIQRLKSENLSLEDKINKLAETGNDLIDSFKYPENNDYNKYSSLVPLYSYLKYINQIVYDCIYDKEKIPPEEFKLEKYSKELDDIYKEIIKLFSPYENDYLSFRSKVINEIDNIYNKVFNDKDLNYESFVINESYIFVHIKPTDIIKEKIKKNEYVSKNSKIGEVEKYPDKMSEKNDNNIKNAIKFYDKKKYEDAVKILEKAYIEEPDNPFVLNYYAKSLYWLDGKKSFDVYRKLINLLDAADYKSKSYIEFNSSREAINNITNEKIKKEISDVNDGLKKISGKNVIIDLWFLEAYWKIGTLYLDKEDYLRGAYEITRALLGGIGNNDMINEQAFGFLAESYTYLKKYELAKYCAEKTLTINPKNNYVQRYLNIIQKEYLNKQ